MILFLVGTQGIGKTTLAAGLAGWLRWEHLECDALRNQIKKESKVETLTTTLGFIEDALNWRVYTRASQISRSKRSCIIDSTGASSRFLLLRQSLADYQQKVILLTSAIAWDRCQRKWDSRITQKQFLHNLQQIQANCKSPDLSISIDNKDINQLLDLSCRALNERPPEIA